MSFKKTLFFSVLFFLSGCLFFQAASAVDIKDCSKFFPEPECEEIKAEIGDEAFSALSLFDNFIHQAGGIVLGPVFPFGGFKQIVDRVINYLFWIVLVIAPLCFLFSAVSFIKAAGNIEKAQRARKILIWAVIGLAIAFTAKVFTGLINHLLGV